jgi:S-adenosylmethionine:tRNA ribosyltransferase-isomerase
MAICWRPPLSVLPHRGGVLRLVVVWVHRLEHSPPMGWTPAGGAGRSPVPAPPESCHIVPFGGETPMDATSLHYDLPPSAIAQTPAEPRDAARLLVDEGPGREASHRRVRDLSNLARPGDVWVLNTTRVLPARLRGRRPTGGAVEVLLLDPEPDGSTWRALVRPSRRVRPGTVVDVGPGLAVEVGEDLGEGRRRVTPLIEPGRTLEDALDRLGEVPLPPYITTPLADPERYQTVYGDRPGSVAAPTAGLHLTTGLLAALRERGVELAHVELVVGLGTFRPISVDDVDDHVMHAERYRVPAETLEACAAATRVVAVGTTSVRALESATRTGRLEGATELFLHGDDGPTSIDVLLTNLHQPRSSLLALVESFIGPRWRHLYETAVAEGYRFLSFGDATWLVGERGDR